MAYLDGFDASKVNPNEPIGPIPAGPYLAMMTASERKQNKSGNGEHLEVKFTVQDGQYKGRSITNRLNLWHPNQTAARIAAGDMSAICRAVGVIQPRDSSDLHNLPLEITVACTNPDANGRIFNEIKGYAKRGTSQQSATQQPAPPASSGPDDSAAPTPAWLQS